MSTGVEPQRDLVGQIVLGRYRIMHHLADGGMGAIYLARNEGAAGFIRPVVVKCLLPSRLGNDQMLKMFMREARIMSTLRHPGIVGVIDFAEHEDMYVMVMEYVHGFHLGRWHKFMRKSGRPFPIELAVHITIEVLRALHYAHTLKRTDGVPLNIVHRDVTPSNVLIDVDGHVKLSDFGIARTDVDRTAADDRAIKGKFPYLAPELLQGQEPSPACDVYSAGLILHELLIGKNEFHHREVPLIIARVLQHQPTRVDALRECPPGLADIVDRALAKSAQDRWQSAADLADALAEVRSGTPDQAAKLLAEAASRDFRDPQMADTLKLTHLEELEACWSTPSGVHLMGDPRVGNAEAVDVDDSWTSPSPGVGSTPTTGPQMLVAPRPSAAPAPSAEDVPTRAGGDRIYEEPGTDPDDYDAEYIDDTPHIGKVPVRRRDAAAAPLPARRRAATARTRPAMVVLIVVGVLALLGVGAVSVIALLRSRDRGDAEEPQYIVVKDRNSAREPAEPTEPAVEPLEPPVAPPAAAGDAAPVAPAGADPRPDKPPPRSGPPETSADRLTRTFARQKGKVTACFRDHAGEVSGAPRIEIRFVVGADGKVITAELQPAALSASALGGCLLGVARRTAFGPQQGQVSFRVPLKVSQ